jgi:hypothetical protein
MRFSELAERGPDKNKNQPRDDDDRNQKPEKPDRRRQRLAPLQHPTLFSTSFSAPPDASTAVDGSQRRTNQVAAAVSSVADTTALSPPIRAPEMQRQEQRRCKPCADADHVLPFPAGPSGGPAGCLPPSKGEARAEIEHEHPRPRHQE